MPDSQPRRVEDCNGLTAAGFSKVSDRAQFGVDRSTAEPTVVQVSDGLSGVLFGTELDVDVPHKVVPQVVADVHLLNFAVPENILDLFTFKISVCLKPFFIECTYDCYTRPSWSLNFSASKSLKLVSYLSSASTKTSSKKLS